MGTTHRRVSCLWVVFCSAVCLAGPVISWVAPYRVSETQTMLQRSFGAYGMKDGLTYLALQFYRTEGAQLGRDGNIRSQDFDNVVRWFVDWGHANDVRVMLCIHNYVDGWNWPEARRSFRDNRAAFLDAVMDEVARMNFDGVEVDMEGVGDFGADGDDFIRFIRDLSGRCHALDKHCTIASFCYIWNAPNSDWWPEMMKDVDGITSMGYEEIGRNASPAWASYAGQKALASEPLKLMIGMPGGAATWQGDNVVSQIEWVVEDGEVGIGIWDASLGSTAWQTEEVWRWLAQIKASHATAVRPHRTELAAAPSGPSALMLTREVRDRLSVSFNLPHAANAQVTVFDPAGRLVARLFSGACAAGTSTVSWYLPAQRSAAGLYIVTVTAGMHSLSRNLVLTR